MSARGAVSRLDELAQLASEADNDSVATRCAELAERLADGRYYVTCLGQFKRGKSTLVNALAGWPVVPVGVAPVTSVVTVVRCGEPRRGRVQRADGSWDEVPIAAIAGFVSQAHNPDNSEGVRAVEVCTPSPLLALGMCLVDTPGIGSVFLANTHTTHAFVPHVDAALVVLGGDPPISADELELVGEIAGKVPEIVFLLNKVDRLSGPERREARRFTEDTLRARLGGAEPRIFEVSATKRLEGDASYADWEAFEGVLRDLAGRGGEVLLASEERGIRRLGAELGRDLARRREALERPIAESEARIAELARYVSDARLALRDLRYLFDGEQQAVLAAITTRSGEFVRATVPAICAALAKRLAEPEGAADTAFRARSFTVAQELARAEIQGWSRTLEPEATALYRTATDRFVAIANDFLARLARAQPELEDVCHPLEREVAFRVRSRFFPHEHLHLTGRSPLSWLADRFRSEASARRAAERRALRYVQRLVRTNAARIQSDLVVRFLGSRERLEREIGHRLDETLGSAERALRRATSIHAEGASARAAELERIESLRQRLPGG